MSEPEEEPVPLPTATDEDSTTATAAAQLPRSNSQKLADFTAEYIAQLKASNNSDDQTSSKDDGAPKEFRKSLIAYKTPDNKVGTGSCIYLDRHNVQCRPGHVLCAFKLATSGLTMWYEFWGLDIGKDDMAQNKMLIATGATKPDSEGGGRNIFLDRHEVR